MCTQQLYSTFSLLLLNFLIQNLSSYYRDEILTKSEIRAISEKSLLKSSHINAAQTMIRKRFPEIGGLYPCQLGINLKFPTPFQQKWIQIIHDPDMGHWLVAAKGFLNSKNVIIFDSLLFQHKKRVHSLACISSLLKTQEETFDYIIKPCQKQSNNFDCGVFAIGFAVSLCFGDDPSSIVYDVNQMRRHLRQWYIENQIDSPFPSWNTKAKKRDVTKQINVYCDCRVIDLGRESSLWDMILCVFCKKWFHRKCCSFPKKYYHWKCHHCSK